MLGREGSEGFPGKNVYPVLGRALMEYPLLAALNSKLIDRVYVSTDSKKIKEISIRHGAKIIDRPDYLCTKEALGEDAYVHGYDYIKNNNKEDIEFMILLFCNAPCVLPSHIEQGIKALKENPDYDSAVTVSKYNMFSPVRARKIEGNGLLHPFIPFENYPKGMLINCDRDKQGDVYFADVCLVIVRPYCLENIESGILPQRWMGQKIYPIKQWGGLDVDYKWQLPQVEYWLREHGFSEERVPYIK